MHLNHSLHRLFAILAAAAILAVLTSGLAPRFAGAETVRVSTASDGTQANGASGFRGSNIAGFHHPKAAMSGDGRYVAFMSWATNLVEGDTNGERDIFVKDLNSGRTTRVSTTFEGKQGRGESFSPSISNDGRYVAFASSAPDLVEGDTNRDNDVFVKDVETGQLVRVSTSATGGQANNRSVEATISGNGRYVTFSSEANNLVAGDTNDYQDVFVKEVLRDGRLYSDGQITRANTTREGAQALRPVSTRLFTGSAPGISDDGQKVVFESLSGNLVSGDDDDFRDVFVKDMSTGSIVRANTLSGSDLPLSAAHPSNTGSGGAAISGDGLHVAFEYHNTIGIAVKNLRTGATTFIDPSWHGQFPSLSYDGSQLTYGTWGEVGIPDTGAGIIRVNLETRQKTLVSRTSSGWAANENNWEPMISDDGRFVAYTSTATNLIDGDTNATADVYRAGTAVPTVPVIEDISKILNVRWPRELEDPRPWPYEKELVLPVQAGDKPIDGNLKVQLSTGTEKVVAEGTVELAPNEHGEVKLKLSK